MRRTLAILMFASVALRADGPEFDVASIKATPPNPSGMILIAPPRGGPGTADPTHVTWPSATLRGVLGNAFNVKNYQVTGPDTLDSERFEIAVGIPDGATKEQVALMWRNLLISRFGLKYHIEQREFPVDELTVGPKGHKLVENKDQADAEPAKLPLDAAGPPGRPPLDKEGRPTLNGPGLMMLMSAGPNGPTAKTMAKAQPMSEFVKMLSNQLGHPVVDKTGLAGTYDFSLDFQPTAGLSGGPLALATRRGGPDVAGAAPPTSAAPAEMSLELPQAIEQQLGLRLVKGKGMLDVIVVEKINRVPTEN